MDKHGQNEPGANGPGAGEAGAGGKLGNDEQQAKLQRLRNIVLSSDNVVFFGGAGVSTESGIPDFRSADGLYNQHYAYPPEVMLSRTFYDKHPHEFFRFYYEKILKGSLGAKPNAAHMALARLEDEGHVRAILTQNIDGLHQVAGSKNVLELHGSIHRNYCDRCGAYYDASMVLAQLEAEQAGSGLREIPGQARNDVGSQARNDANSSHGAPGDFPIPHCTKPGCNGTIKPDVVLYEEPLDIDILNAAADAAYNADVFIVGGTSLVVNPAASLVGLFSGSHLIVINKSRTSRDSQAELVFHDSIGKVLGSLV
jgi:NAD-dependent deacetylase